MTDEWQSADDSSGEIKTPPMSELARREAGFSFGDCSKEIFSLSRTRAQCQTLVPRCHELRVNDENKTWRIIYRIDDDAILVVDVFEKKTQKTPQRIIATCKRRLRLYDTAAKEE